MCARVQHIYLLLQVCSCVWGPEGAIRCLSSLPLCLETRSLTELIDWPGWMANEHQVSAYHTPGSASARITGTASLAFCISSGDSNSVLCVCMTGTLSTEQFSQPPYI